MGVEIEFHKIIEENWKKFCVIISSPLRKVSLPYFFIFLLTNLFIIFIPL